MTNLFLDYNFSITPTKIEWDKRRSGDKGKAPLGKIDIIIYASKDRITKFNTLRGILDLCFERGQWTSGGSVISMRVGCKDVAVQHFGRAQAMDVVTYDAVTISFIKTQILRHDKW